MAETNETSADIIAEMETERPGLMNAPINTNNLYYARRLKAALERERGDCAKLRKAANAEPACNTGMSEVLLVKPEGLDSIFQVSTFECAPFEVWKDRDGVDLLWRGRRVEKVYSKTGAGERWWSVPIPNAARSLLKHGKAKRMKTMATPEGELPR